ncbi:hypothetical protein [Streptomyces sp. NPDC005438]|uniref:hypothetical protein n=1 Tax=Streptomyces sp. NPDC005438 TaxID=3156880 RepID=UPI0033B8C476
MAPSTTTVPPQQDALLREITQLLTDALPERWHQLLIDYRQLGRHMNLAVGLRRTAEAELELWEPPIAVWRLFQMLRHGMYDDQRGTWFSARYTLDHRGDYDIRYNHHRRPTWGSPTAEDFRQELERYPRAPEHQPDWFRTGLDG